MATETGMVFPVNNVTGSNVALVLDGANLLPRLEHTAIWRYKPSANNSYRAVAWHSPNIGPPITNWDGGIYSWGTHPYPVTSGGVDANGISLKAGGVDGPVTYWEQAGLGIAGDFLTSPGGSSGLQVVVDQWYVQVRKCRVIVGGPNDGLTEHIFIPDLIGNPSFVISQYFYDINSGSIPVSGVYPSGAGVNPAFYFGASDWTAYGSGQNSETLSGVLRGIQLYSVYLSDSDHAIEAANTTSNTPQTSAGQANVWYMNQNPTPTDITDKSSAGHTPSWRNSYRPTLYSLEVADVAVAIPRPVSIPQTKLRFTGKLKF